MSNEITNFDFHNNTVRLHAEGEHVEYCAKDVATTLGYVNTNDAISRHCRGVVKRYPITDSLGRTQEAAFISEGDVYRLIASSKLPAAVEFEHWLFDEVVPSIRKHGAYMTEKTIEDALLNPDTIIKLATELKNERQARLQAQSRAQELEPKASAYDAFTDAEELMLIRDAAKYLTAASLPITEHQLRTWMVEHKWIYKHDGTWKPYANRSSDGTLRLVPAHNYGHHLDGSTFAYKPTCRITRKGLALLYKTISSQRFDNSLGGK